MSNKMKSPGTPKRSKGREFKPREPYTLRLRKILEEYPDGSQVLREILQNSDDAKSTEQVFILDHNTYPSNSVFEPDLEDNYQRTNLKLDRYQGPALLSKNNTIFEERDFQSLLKLANSEKRDQFDKIGVMGVGFNSIYHITDSPSFITGDKYVILDPHEWYFEGGVQFDFVEEDLAKEYPHQFAPFRIPCDKPFKGTLFRYPLRTTEDSIDSNISKKVYKPDEILEMFNKFYENESINCLLFLKYIECISFYELKVGATEPNLLYTIRLENANRVREQRHLIVKKIVSMMDSLKSKKLCKSNQSHTTYVASFSRQKGDSMENREVSSWLILNYLDDIYQVEAYFQEKFNKDIGEYKFIPNVGLAVPLNWLNIMGRLFCFLPLPVSMPFQVSVNGYFAVSTNRRSLWSAADNEDLAADALARLKVTWNRYLFENILPKAWAEFLREIPLKVIDINPDNLYRFWPIIESNSTVNISTFCKDLLQNVINCLGVEDRVFKGPSSSSPIGKVANIPAKSYLKSSLQEFHWLSLSNGYFEDPRSNYGLSKILGKIGFPVILVSHDIIKALKDSNHEGSLRYFSPAIIRTYLNQNRNRWNDTQDNNTTLTISRKEILQLFGYILKDKKFNELEGFKMIPLADGTLGTLSLSSNSHVYICPRDDYKNHELDIFKDQLDNFIDKSIDFGLYQSLYEFAKAGWNLNIKVLDEVAVANMIRFSLKLSIVDRNWNLIGIIKKSLSNSEEIQMSDHREWVYKLWDNLKYRNWDLTKFEDIPLLPTSRSTLRKLNTPKKIFSNQTSKNISTNLSSIFEKFGAVFVEDEFDRSEVSKWAKPDDILSVLNSLRTDSSYPKNLNHELKIHEASTLVDHLSNHLRLANKYHFNSNHIEIIKHLPIFIEVDHTYSIPLLPAKKSWYLLPKSDENTYGKVIYPSNMGGFLSTSSQNLSYILEDIIKIPRLNSYEYWKDYVIPFLYLQQQTDLDIVIDKLFDKLPFLLDHDSNLKDVLGRTSFVPVGTLKMSLQQQMPDNIKLAKPTELFDPEEREITGLFFEEEQVFPAGKYGVPKASASNKFFSNLKLLGMRSILSPDDVNSRINSIVKKRKIPDVREYLIHAKAFKIFKYIDDKWDTFVIQNRNTRETKVNDALKTILETEWIPTVDASEKKIFSKRQNCYSQKDKYLVCLVTPLLEYKVKNKRFLKYLKWDTYPEVKTVLKQLEFCQVSLSNKQPPEHLEMICNAIYKYINDALRANDETSMKEADFMKKCLKNHPWILCRNTLHPTDKVVFSLPIEFQNNNSSFVELPEGYKSDFWYLFKEMGVRNELEIKDLITIISNMVKGNMDRDLSADEIKRVIKALELISKHQRNSKSKRGENHTENLDGLLVPSNKNRLVRWHEIQYNDIGDRFDEENESEYKITHKLVTQHMAKDLGIQHLKGKLCAGDEIFEQNESLTTRIKNIIKDYSLNQLFKEFLQNADDAKATQFSVTIDERKKFQYHSSNKYLLTEEIEDWQGPAIWIYNDAKFTEKDFRSLKNLGVGGKGDDDSKIGRFGLGFNCAFHLTDIPSFVSGKHIVFIDPSAKYLPAQGSPPRKCGGMKYQCLPYEVMGCDFSEEFNGTLFRLPIRTSKLAEKSEISDQPVDIKKIFKLLSEVQSNKEMLFLRNIESCSLHHIKEQEKIPRPIWETRINMSHDDRNIRRSVIDKIQLYQMEIEINKSQNKKASEIWLLCTGGFNTIIKSALSDFSKKKNFKPRGGVASLLAQSNEKSLNELKAESFPNPPELKGEMFSYLSLSISTNLGVHLNGNFSLSSSRSNLMQSDNDFLLKECDDTKWNRYIFFDILPSLHIRLFERIVDLEKIRHVKDKADFIPHTLKNLWPINDNVTTNLYKSYGSTVIKKLGHGGHRVFWTEANGGKFVPLKDGKIDDGEEEIIADVLTDLGIPILKLDKNKIEHIKDIAKQKRSLGFDLPLINEQMVCEVLRTNRENEFISSLERKINNENSDNKKTLQDSIFIFLRYILGNNNISFKELVGLPLVPLNDGSVGKFGEIYYIGKQKHIDLFPNVRPSKFVTVKLPKDLLNFFKQNEFSVYTNIKEFDADAILHLLSLMFKYEERNELDYDHNGKGINGEWLEEIWSKLKFAKAIDYGKLSKFPILPIIQPKEVLVRLDGNNPVLNVPEGSMIYPVLKKLKLRFTNMKFTDTANPNLKQCILQCTPVNVINSLERACVLLNLTMNRLFETSNLSLKDYERFRSYVYDNHKSLTKQGQKQERFMKILRSLPIWATHSYDNKFIDAESGFLLPNTLPFFSFKQDAHFYKCDEPDYHSLFGLGVTSISEKQYVELIFIHVIAPSQDYMSTPPHEYITTEPSQEYITFLQKALTLGNSDIENFFARRPVIPNKSLKLVMANTLYDSTVPLFYHVFKDTDKFLPSVLCGNHRVMMALGRIGLKLQVNSKTFIECVQEIRSQIDQPTRFPMTVVKTRAKFVLEYLYSNHLNFSDDQWNQIMHIKFIPSEFLQNSRFYENAIETSGFESFALLCSQKYKEVCWTQRPFFDKSVEPTEAFIDRYPTIGKPFVEDVINHWFLVVEKIRGQSSSWRSSGNYPAIKGMIKKIYEEMNAFSQENNLIRPISERINTERKLFLNGEDLLDRENWLAGRELVFGIEEDIRAGLHKVNECLMPYKNLLILGGVQKLEELDELDENEMNGGDGKHDQKEHLFKNLMDKLKSHPDTRHHDVIFIVGENATKIGANRYVLSAASSYFHKMFCGHTAESIENRLVEVIIEDIRSDAFQVFLQWLYGETFEIAKNSILRKKAEFGPDEDYVSYCLSFLIDLLKITDRYEGKPLKDIVEFIIMKEKEYINVNNVCEILEWAKDCNALKLKERCEKYINKNRSIIFESRWENIRTVENEEDRSNETQMLDLLLNN